MVRLGLSKALGRKARIDPPPELGISTWKLLEDALGGEGRQGAAELLSHCHFESRNYHDSLMSLSNSLFQMVADLAGEDVVEKFWRQRFAPRVTDWLEKCRTAEDVVQRVTEAHRGHFSNVTVFDEPDRYVVKLDPCFGGKMRRDGLAVAATRQPHAWSWNKTGVPYYCVHCAVMLEILPVEIRGYALGITEFSDDPKMPCFQYFYKSPESIPSELTKRIAPK